MPRSRTAAQSIGAAIRTSIQATETRLAAGYPLDNPKHPNHYAELALSIRAAAQAVLRALLPSEVHRVGNDFADVSVNTTTVDPWPDISASQFGLRMKGALKKLARYCMNELPGKAMRRPKTAILYLEDVLAKLGRSSALLPPAAGQVEAISWSGKRRDRRGRKALPETEAQKRESLIASWVRFRDGECGTKKDFCKDHHINVKRLNDILAWKRTRRNRLKE